MMNEKERMPRAAVCLALAAALTACAGPEPAEEGVEVEIRGTDPQLAALPAGAPSAATAGDADIVDYGDYQVAVAEPGDTVATLAARLGLSASELGAYNGIQPSTELRAGDELVLPQGTAAAVAAAPAPAPAASDDGSFEVAALPAGQSAVNPFDADPSMAGALEPVEVEPDEYEPVVTDPLPAAAPDTAPTPAPATGRQWSPNLAAAAIERGEPVDPRAPGGLPPPPSAGQPLPESPGEPRDLASPDLGQYQSPTALATPFQLTRPVQGPVAIPYNVGTGPQRNEGVDFAAPAGAPVVAAEDGEVALVSESLGGLGTIVLLRHPNDLLTVYGRLGDVAIEKGDYLERGQQLGVVADAPAGTEPRMHFEVRSGADSVDPMTML